MFIKLQNGDLINSEHIIRATKGREGHLILYLSTKETYSIYNGIDVEKIESELTK